MSILIQLLKLIPYVITIWMTWARENKKLDDHGPVPRAVSLTKALNESKLPVTAIVSPSLVDKLPEANQKTILTAKQVAKEAAPCINEAQQKLEDPDLLKTDDWLQEKYPDWDTHVNK